MTQKEKAAAFASLHQKGAPLVLYNIWDAGGAKTLEKAGAKAIATGSWSVAAAQGYEDGEALPLPLALEIYARIAASTSLPVTVDFEGAYATLPEKAAANVRKVIRAGAIGINFEDRVVGGEGLHPVSDQVARLHAIRATSEEEDVPLFINARTDLFLGSDPARHAELVPEALDRCAAYAEAGASGFFVPGLTDLDLIEKVTTAATLPVNVMMRGGLASLRNVAQAGVARASYGPGPYVHAMSDLAARFAGLEA